MKNENLQGKKNSGPLTQCYPRGTAFELVLFAVKRSSGMGEEYYSTVNAALYGLLEFITYRRIPLVLGLERIRMWWSDLRVRDYIHRGIGTLPREAMKEYAKQIANALERLVARVTLSECEFERLFGLRLTLSEREFERLTGRRITLSDHELNQLQEGMRALYSIYALWTEQPLVPLRPHAR